MGDKIKIRIAVTHPNTAGATGDIEFTTWLDTAATLQIEQTLISKTISATDAPLDYEFRRQMMPEQMLRQNIYAPIRFTLTSPTTITKLTGEILVTLTNF